MQNEKAKWNFAFTNYPQKVFEKLFAARTDFKVLLLKLIFIVSAFFFD